MHVPFIVSKAGVAETTQATLVTTPLILDLLVKKYCCFVIKKSEKLCVEGKQSTDVSTRDWLKKNDTGSKIGHW